MRPFSVAVHNSCITGFDFNFNLSYSWTSSEHCTLFPVRSIPIKVQLVQRASDWHELFPCERETRKVPPSGWRWTEIINYDHLSIENPSTPVVRRKIRFDHDSHRYRIEPRAKFFAKAGNGSILKGHLSVVVSSVEERAKKKRDVSSSFVLASV